MKNQPVVDLSRINPAAKNDEVNVSQVPSVQRKKAQKIQRSNTMKKIVLGNERVFHHEVVEAGTVEQRTTVFDLNERDQELLNEHGVADILPEIKKEGRNNFEVFARKQGDNLELADGSRRRRACILGKAALLAWVCNDLTDREMEYLSDSGNQHKQASVYERGLLYQRWLDTGRYTSNADIARERDVDRRTVGRCINAAKLPKWLIAAYKTPNDMSVESAGQLFNMMSKQTIDETLLKKRVDGCKIIWNHRDYCGADITKMLLDPVITNEGKKPVKPKWLAKKKAKLMRTEQAVKIEIAQLNEEKEKQLSEFIEQLLK